MNKFILAFLAISLSDCWTPIVMNTKRNYSVKGEGKLFTPLHSLNEEIIHSDLLIDGDSTKRLRMVYSSAFPMGDTVKLEIFDNEESYAHSFKVIILKDKYLIQYSREINFSEWVQKFEPIKSKLELETLDLSKGNKIRGHVEYIGKCVSGCSDNKKKIRIEGNFVAKINRY